MKKRLTLYALTLILTVIPMLSFANQQVIVERVAGNNRYQTSIRVNHFFDSAEYAIIASGEHYADALTSGQLAGALNAPLYVTQKDAIADDLIEDLERLNVSKVYVIGGESTISKAAEEQLRTPQAGFEVERLAGANRYETSLRVAEKMEDLRGEVSTPLYLASGQNFPDALSATPLVNHTQGILQLHPNRTIDTNIYPNPILFGGANSLPGEGFTRIAGANRYDTSLAIAKQFEGDGDLIFVVDGSNYPDALSVAGVAADNDAPILLMPKTGVPEGHMEIIRNRFKHVIIIGGENSIPPALVEELTEKAPIEEPEKPVLTEAQEHAKARAISYLESQPFSKENLIAQLIFEEINAADARIAVDDLTVDWTAQAAKKAENYLANSGFSAPGLREQLLFEKFTEDEVDTAMDAIDVDWNAEALEKAKAYLEIKEMTRRQMYNQLIFEGFTEEQVTYALDTLELI